MTGGRFWSDAFERAALFVAAVACAGYLSVQIGEQQRIAAPPSNWLVVSSVTVFDGPAAAPPRMKVIREIRQPFSGHWVATVRRIDDGSLAAACLAEGRADYSPEARFPPDMSLDWWTWPTKCNLPAGTYRLDTRWTIQPVGYPAKEVRANSNQFTLN